MQILSCQMTVYLNIFRQESPTYLSSGSLQLFHCKDYINCIQNIQEILTSRECSADDDDDDDLYELAELELDIHGLGWEKRFVIEILLFSKMSF